MLVPTAGSSQNVPTWKEPVMSNAAIAANAALAEPWKDLWNGDLSLTEKIIAEDFVAHAAPLTGAGTDQIRGRQALNGWVSGIHAILGGLAFVIEVGPIADEEHMVVRWKARGTYRGGFPGASPEAVGREVTSPAPTRSRPRTSPRRPSPAPPPWSSRASVSGSSRPSTPR